jgi:hypothetical protein
MLPARDDFPDQAAWQYRHCLQRIFLGIVAVRGRRDRQRAAIAQPCLDGAQRIAIMGADLVAIRSIRMGWVSERSAGVAAQVRSGTTPVRNEKGGRNE